MVGFVKVRRGRKFSQPKGRSIILDLEELNLLIFLVGILDQERRTSGKYKPHLHLRNHENFSYGNNKNVLQPPPGFNQQAVEKKHSVKHLLSTFIVETRGRFKKDEARLDNIETHCDNMNATMKSLEVQIGQLANAVKGQSSGNFPSDMEPNPNDHCKAITLRSGR
ncbi:hypothetical protein TIFTF001_032286 [Ficus carica]|uniref:Uncharacterized protein n=1 Tax=Ficus carica TaxID=3494 RepID=A0AA88E384_FICCA|nr:hypothetical protein TIFTF001_032286 [Ficus carica]